MSDPTQKIEFIEDGHLYLLNGIIIPSVSAIIQDGSYDSIPAHILEYAAERGTAVHLAAEMIDKNKKHNLEIEFMPWLIQYLLFQREYAYGWDCIESVVHTNKFAGTIDRIGTYNGKILIADIKTTSKLYEKKIALQLAGYIKAHAEQNNNKITDYLGAVIWLKKDAWEFKIIEPDFTGFEQKLSEYIENEIA